VPKVGPAACAEHLGPHHVVRAVGCRYDVEGGYRGRETGPTRPRIEFPVRAEEVGAAAGAAVEPRFLTVVVFAGERRLGALLPRNPELLCREDCPPFAVGLFNPRNLLDVPGAAVVDR